MEKNITCPEYYSDEATKTLLEYLDSQQALFELNDSSIYYNFPMFKELDQDLQYPSLCIVSKKHGVILVLTDDILEREINEQYLNNLDEKLSQLYSSIHSKFFKVKALKKNRESLKFPINTFIYLPNCNRHDIELENEIINSLEGVRVFLSNAYLNETLSDELVKNILSIIDGATGIVKPAERLAEIDNENKGKVLVELEKEINSLDRQQKFAALTQINGPQRIRGLAGSGKTVILCMKAANILMKNPEAKILYTFYTKSLYQHIKLLISRFYRVYSEKDPDFINSIHVRHAWGGVSYPGVYYDTCKNNRIEPLKLTDAKGNNKFEYVCTDLLEKTNGRIKKEYDYVIMDEAQDFPEVFYWLCRKIVKDDNLVWAYDQLQNILNVNIQNTKTLFKNKYGDQGIDLEKLLEGHPELNNDIVLPICYRNPREVLVLAHSIGFGIYSERIVQILQNVEHWNDHGYEMIQGACNEGEETIIIRPEKNSPLSISKKYSIEKIIETYNASSIDDEVEWVVNSIIENLEDGLLPQDIMIICLDQNYMFKYKDKLADLLNKKDIYMNNTLDSYNNEFVREGCVTYTSVYKAKGNESALVYVIGCDVFNRDKENIIMRNKIFTAFTRSKAWLKVTGVGENFLSLQEEINKTIENFPFFKFIYPNKDSVKEHQRDLSKINASKEAFAKLVRDFAKQNGLTTDEAIKIFKKGIDIEDIYKE